MGHLINPISLRIGSFKNEKILDFVNLFIILIISYYIKNKIFFNFFFNNEFI